MLEFILEALGEFFVQVVFEALLELALHAFNHRRRRQISPELAAAGYALLGVLIGGISLLIFPRHLTPSGVWRLLNLLVTPIAIGGCMSVIGAWRARRGDPVLRIDRFADGYVFAFSVAVVRLIFAG